MTWLADLYNALPFLVSIPIVIYSILSLRQRKHLDREHVDRVLFDSFTLGAALAFLYPAFYLATTGSIVPYYDPVIFGYEFVAVSVLAVVSFGFKLYQTITA